MQEPLTVLFFTFFFLLNIYLPFLLLLPKAGLAERGLYKIEQFNKFKEIERVV